MASADTSRRIAGTKTVIYSGALAVCTAAALATGVNAHSGDDCDATRDISAELSLDGIREISVDAGAGKLVVLGQSGISSARIEGVACAKRERDLDDFEVKSRRDGETLILETVLPDSSLINFGSDHARLDLEIRLPSSLPIRIDDTSGSLVVEGVASVAISDNSGSISVQDVSGLVHILDDGSGSITIARAGSVRIDEDGSGSITASDIREDVYIGRDGSGSISADTVGGSFTVARDGSGSVRHSNVVGEVRIDD
ncbi:MAG: hypothetical protein AAFY44_15515 [Pseudomonadota bacterium]